jgi:hypothetical protein
MIPATREDQKKEAFRLFEDGRYQESFQFCTLILNVEKDPAIEILAATNLYYTGKIEDADVFFRDLAQKMPDSSYVHSYLAKVLEAKGDEGAIAEYATAVHLDPNNQDALRSYADYLLSRQDFQGGIPVLKRLVQLGKKPGDIQNLMRALIEVGEPQEALDTHAVLSSDHAKGQEYIEALIQTNNFQEAVRSAQKVYRETKNPVILRKYLSALSRYDPPASFDAYASLVKECQDCNILFDYIQLLKTHRDYVKALEVTRILLAHSGLPMYRLNECDLLAALGEKERALKKYELLILEELRTKNDLNTLELIISRYRHYMMAHLPAGEVTRRFLNVVSQDVNVVSLLATAHLYDDFGDVAEARSWYYRAYRADFLAGGLEYAKFLLGNGEERECEKVMLYLLSNVKKNTDLGRVASVIVNKNGKMHNLRRLLDQLIQKLTERRNGLNTEGLELLAVAFFIAATNALDEMDYAGCKYFCLCGMDVMPSHARTIRIENFLELIRACKERSVTDRLIMDTPHAKKLVVPVLPAKAITDQLDLSEAEQKVVEFLRIHRKASEMDLRTLLGTRRVVGIVNKLIQKASAQGQSIIDKKGVGEDGEIYEYIES